MGKYSDVSITCSQCGKNFTFTEDEQEFYKVKGFTQPHRCKPCRSSSRPQNIPICSKCGDKIVHKDNITCSACLIGVQLEADMKVGGLQNKLDEVTAKLATLEAQPAVPAAETQADLTAAQAEISRITAEANTRIGAIEAERDQVYDLLKQKEQVLVELEWRLSETTRELEKARQYQGSLEGLQPSLSGLNERLGFLDRNQSVLVQALLQMADKLDEKHKNPGFVDILKDLVRLDHSRATD